MPTEKKAYTHESQTPFASAGYSGAAEVTTAGNSEKDLWAAETNDTGGPSEHIAATPTNAIQAKSDPHVDAASITDAVVAAAATSDIGKQVLQESEAALNARVRALQLENAQLELEFRQHSVASEAQQSLR